MFGARGVQDLSPADGRLNDAEPEEAERRLGEDGPGDAETGGHQNGRQRVRKHMAEDDPGTARAQRNTGR